MEFNTQYLSFYVIEIEDESKRVSHYQTLDQTDYDESQLQNFLDGEFTKIAKRKVERHAKSENSPTKIGRFIVEEGHDLTSNPNYNIFHHLRYAENKEIFQEKTHQIAEMYAETSAVRGGALIVATAKLAKYFDDPFLFIIKCDFEPKVATITDASTLIHQVEMAITTKNMKSIQYPYMPEEGMLDEAEVKVHQASHARYFEDFLPYVAYEKSLPEIVRKQVVDIVQEHIEEVYPETNDEKVALEEELEEWAVTPKRELQERLSTEQIVEATSQITEHAPEVELKMKLDHVSLKALLADFGDTIHLAKVNGRYVLIIEAENIQFDKSFSPIEFHKPDHLMTVIEKVVNKP